MAPPLTFRPLSALWALLRFGWWSFVVLLARPRGRRPPHPSYVDAVWLRALARDHLSVALSGEGGAPEDPHSSDPPLGDPSMGDRHGDAETPQSPTCPTRPTRQIATKRTSPK